MRVGLSALITPRDEMTVLTANTKRHSSRPCESCNRVQAVPRPGGAENFTRTDGGTDFYIVSLHIYIYTVRAGRVACAVESEGLSGWLLPAGVLHVYQHTNRKHDSHIFFV